MKTALLCLLIILGTTTIVSASESACHTDGCVFAKNAQMTAVLNWVNSNDECINVVSWLQSVTRLNDNQFQIICGDTHDREVITLEAKVTNDMTVELKRL